MAEYEVAVIGAGPAGYVAAIRAAQLGLRVVCIDGFQNAKGEYSLGGTCLNVGCIPSKALLETSHKYHQALHDFKSEGIVCDKISINLDAIMQRKNTMVKNLTGGIAALFKANGVELVQGRAQVVAKNTIKVAQNSKEISIQAKNIILAAGSAPVELPSAPFNGDNIVDSTGALSFASVPKTLAVIGAGVIGLELGSVWSRLGAEVTLIEALPDFLPMADKDVGKKTLPSFKKQGLNIWLDTKLQSAKATKKGVTLTLDKKGTNETLTVEKVIVAVGRKPMSADLCAPEVGIEVDARGFVVVDQHCCTSIANIYAVGDLVRGPMLAHKGSEEGVMVVERIAGEHTEVNYGTVPNVVYTSPEIAWVGKTEQDLKKEGVVYNTGVFPLAASGRAMANNNTTGFVKTIIEQDSNRILGVHMVCDHAGELLAQAVTAMEFGAVAEDIAMTMFAHPTLSEAVKESTLASLGHALHVAPRKK